MYIYIAFLNNILPFTFPCILIAILIPRSTNSAIFLKSSSFNSRVVIAGLPILKPLGKIALLSPGIVFLLAEILAFSSTFSTLAPSIFF